MAHVTEENLLKKKLVEMRVISEVMVLGVMERVVVLVVEVVEVMVLKVEFFSILVVMRFINGCQKCSGRDGVWRDVASQDRAELREAGHAKSLMGNMPEM
ncbi:hypothetical protein E2C01_099628 [Portunus trituberculatus]|uniref:Uncharacterized protein n=1 Tax=Portunus trituberculatus TaxID=210409 RepID=A0A5B7KAX7_PORTR|nr:hypothetical protein [Portunus trituberculatus]